MIPHDLKADRDTIAAAIARMEAHPHRVWGHRIAECRACLDELDALIAAEVTR